MCVFQHPPIDGFLTVSCDFSALAGGDEHTSFYFAILKQSHKAFKIIKLYSLMTLYYTYPRQSWIFI